MNEYAIIVAGGIGSRMQSTVPKQLIPIKGKEIIIHTIEKFKAYSPSIRIIIVIHPDYSEPIYTLLEKYQLETSCLITAGGKTRFHSVKNGLALIQEPFALVAIHDAARPLVSTDTIKRCFEEAGKSGNAIPVIKVSESIRKTIEGSSVAVNRDDYRIVQTPQCFQFHLIKKAFEQQYSSSFTDDATVLEHIGEKIHLVEGNLENIKITTPSDLKIAELYLT